MDIDYLERPATRSRNKKHARALMPRRTLVKERREGAVKLPHIKGEVCRGWGSLLVLFSATEKRTILLVLFKKNMQGDALQ